MTRYLFHLHECASVTNDVEGKEFPDLDAATRHAAGAARHIMGSEVIDGELCLSCHIEIENSDDGSRSTVQFRDVLHITG